MNTVTRDAVEQLTAKKGKALVSIYMPTHPVSSPQHINEDRLRFKNLFSELERYVSADQLSPETAKKLKTQLEALHENQQFWRRQTAGLAVFVTPSQLTYFHLPITTDEQIEINSHFYLTPLFGIVQESTPYYVLALARQHPQLYEGDAYQLHLSEAALPEDPESALHVDGITQGKGAYAVRGQHPNSTIMYGRGGGEREVIDELRRQFFRLVDQAVCRHADTSRVLILAGTAVEVAEYRELSRYPHILTQTIEGNRTADDVSQLHGQAMQVLIAEHEVRQQALWHRYNELVGVGRTATEPAAIQSAAAEGRIESLLVGMKYTTPDNISDNLQPATKLVFPAGAARSVLDKAATATWQNGGDIHACHQEQMPGGVAMAALLRY